MPVKSLICSNSTCEQEYQHIVLLVQHEGKYGAFGISRCPDLMNKDLIFNRCVPYEFLILFSLCSIQGDNPCKCEWEEIA